MKKNLFNYILISTFAIACGKKEDNSLSGKKSSLVELKKESAALQSRIQNLEKEIALLDTNQKSEIKIKPTSVSVVETSIFRHFVSVQGSLEAEENLMVMAKMPGMITSLKVKEGDFVNQGQVLATLDDEILRKSIDEVKAGLDNVVIMYDRQKALWDQKIGTEMQYINLKNQKESLENKLATLKSQKSQALVTAPFSGVIDEIMAKQGTIASPGVPLMQLINTSELKATAKVPDSYVSYIKQGDFVQVKFPDLNKTIEAKVNYIGRVVDPLSRTFKVEVRIPAGNPELKPNLLAMIQINDKTISNSVVIDENIIQSTEEGKVLFVASEESGKIVARQKKVATGLSYGGKVEITSGLAPGEKLITIGYQDLVDNQPISF